MDIKILYTEIEDIKKELYILTIFFIFFILFLSFKFPLLLLHYLFIIILSYIFGLIILFYAEYYKLIRELDKDLNFFIAYLYSLSFITSNIDRFFELASEEKERFKYHSFFLNKIVYMRKKFNYTYPEAIRYILNYIPPSSFRGFLERFATSIEIGEDLPKFLDREHKAKLEEYETNYKKGLENTRLIQDLIMSFTAALGFAFTLILLLPLIANISFTSLIIDFSIIFVGINFIMYYSSKYFVLDDPIWIQSKEKPDKYYNIKMLLLPFSLLSIGIFLFSLKFGLPIIIAISLAISPLTYVSYRMILLERELKMKELKFVGFFSSLLQLSDIMGSNQLKIIAMARNHDFSLLNYDIELLYRRMKITRDYRNSWYFFLKELGSNLAYKTINIFQKILDLGAESKEAGEKLYDILIKVLDLRSFRSQFVSNSRGVLYGTYIGFGLVVFISLQIVGLLNQLFQGFSSLFNQNIGISFGIPLFSVTIPINLLSLIGQIYIIFQAVLIALVIKNLDGGSKIGLFMDLTILLWIGALMFIGVNYFFGKLLTGFTI